MLGLRTDGGRGLTPSWLVRDPWILLLAAYGVVCSAIVLLEPGNHAFMVRFMWINQVPMDAAMCLFAWRAARLPGIVPVVSRYLTTLAVSASLFLSGDLVQVALVTADPDVERLGGGVAQSVLFILGCALLVYRLLRHPAAAATSTRGERLRFYLDAVTVLAGGAVLIWWVSFDPEVTGGEELVSIGLVAGMLLVVTFAAVKLVLSGNAPMTRAASVPMILSAAVMGIGMFLAPASGAELVEQPWLLVLRVVPASLIAIGPRIQELQTRVNPVFHRERRVRPFNLTPYIAIAVTFVVLILVLPGGIGAKAWGVVVGAVLVTMLVVARQVLALTDNGHLISRLDSTLLALRGHQDLLNEQATHDGLTQLVNRTAFGDAVSAELARPTVEPSRPEAGPARPGTTAAVLLIDLDDFKTVNDTLGHAVGDALLVTAAARLRAAVRGNDLVGRLGGDEFAVLLRGVDAGEAGRIAERVIADIGRPIHIDADADAHKLIVRASVGVALATPDDDLSSFMRNADIAMYAAKDAGKGGFRLYSPDLGARIRETAELGARLRDAVGTDQFFLVYQPIVDLHTGSVVGAEALVRWRPPDRPVVPPTEFVPAAERTGLIVPLGSWILRTACAELSRWRSLSPAAESLIMSVNVSGRQLQEPGLVDEVAAALAATGLPADRLMIEVTETAVLDDDVVLDALHALRGIGVGLALDDFGTAASSLGLLLTCPVSTLKLDRSFVDRLGTDSRQRAVATAVIQMARALELGAVAEGVERPEQAELLRALGYRRAQGFLYSAPLPGHEFAERAVAASPPSESIRSSLIEI